MRLSFADNAITAKVKAMYGKRLSKEQYDELCHKKSLGEIAAYLKDNTAYSDMLSSIQAATVGHEQLENILRKNQFANYTNLIRYSSASQRAFYSQITSMLEIELILQLVRQINTMDKTDFVASYPAFAADKLMISLDDLSQVENFDSLIVALRRTEYANVLLAVRPLDGEQIDYTKCESLLMQHYYTRMKELIAKNFRGDTRRQLETIFRTRTELLNIITIYRCKRFYPDMAPEQITEKLLPFWGRLPKGFVQGLVEAKSADELMDKLSSSPYSKYIDTDEYTFLEYGSESVRYNLSKRYIRFAGDAPTAFVSYMFLSEMEVDNIVRIIEAVRYGMDASDILKLLVIDRL